MDTHEVILQFKQFIEDVYMDELYKQDSRALHHIEIDFNVLCQYNLEIADTLLDNPEEIFKAFQVAIEQFDLTKLDNSTWYEPDKL